MKSSILLFLSFVFLTIACKGPQSSIESLKTSHTTNENQAEIKDIGQSGLNISPEDILEFKKRGLVHYSDFGAVGDGDSDDTDAIADTHSFANKWGLKVKADDDVTYYLGGDQRTAIIQTDTDFGTSSFIVDDTQLQNIKAPIFIVNSQLESYKLESITALKRNQEKIDISLVNASLYKVWLER